jgi:transcriptional repressor NF-X1
LLKCSDACLVARRNAALADALGIEKKEMKFKEVEYDPVTLSFYAANVVSRHSLRSGLVWVAG